MSARFAPFNLFLNLDAVYQKFDALSQKIDMVQVTVNAALAKVVTMDAITQAALAALSAEVHRETDLEQAVKTLLEGLAAQIEALKQNQTDPAILAAIQAAADLVKSNNDKFAADVVANTPVPPPTLPGA